MPAPPPESEPAIVSTFGDHAPSCRARAIARGELARLAAAGSAAAMIAETTAMPSAPARDRRAEVAGVEAADRDQRQRAERAHAGDARRPRPRRRHPPWSRSRQRGRGRRSRPPRGRSRAACSTAVERDAEQRVGAEQRARRGGRQVALADVAAGGPGREGDVDPVVDDQRHAERRQQRDQRAGLLEQRPAVGRLVAQLHQRDAALRPRAATISASGRPPPSAGSVTR